MTRPINSAEPEKLFRYSDFGMQLDHELVSESYRLASRLQHFEATCTEPGYQVNVSHLSNALRGYGSQSESTDGWVRQVGRGFQMADSLTMLFRNAQRADSLTGLSEKAKTARAGVEFVEFLASGWLAAGLRGGSTYVGQTVVHGSHRLKEWAGVSSHLTHIKAPNMPAHVAGQAFGVKTIFQPVKLVLEGATEVGENWEEYGGDISKMAIGVVVDTVLGVSVSAVFAGVFSFAGAVIGSAVGPAGTAGGAIIGGKVGAIVGSLIEEKVKAAERIENVKIQGQELDQTVVEAIDERLGPYVDRVVELF